MCFFALVCAQNYIYAMGPIVSLRIFVFHSELVQMSTDPGCDRKGAHSAPPKSAPATTVVVAELLGRSARPQTRVQHLNP